MYGVEEISAGGQLLGAFMMAFLVGRHHIAGGVMAFLVVIAILLQESPSVVKLCRPLFKEKLLKRPTSTNDNFAPDSSKKTKMQISTNDSFANESYKESENGMCTQLRRQIAESDEQQSEVAQISYREYGCEK